MGDGDREVCGRGMGNRVGEEGGSGRPGATGWSVGEG